MNLSDITNFRFYETEHALSGIKRYLEGMEIMLPNVLTAEIGSVMARKPSSGNPEEMAFFEAELDYVEERFRDDFTPLFRYSVIVSLQTVFEDRLRHFCGYIQQIKSLSLASNELRGASEVQLAKKYLSKVAGLDINGIPEWSVLEDYQKVRNCIVHAHGYIDRLSEQKRTELRNIAARMGELMDDYANRLCPTNEFCRGQLDVIESFFCRLYHLPT